MILWVCTPAHVCMVNIKRRHTFTHNGMVEWNTASNFSVSNSRIIDLHPLQNRRNRSPCLTDFGQWNLAEVTEWLFWGEALRNSVLLLFHRPPEENYEPHSCQLQNERQVEQTRTQFTSEAKPPQPSHRLRREKNKGCHKHWNLGVVHYAVLMEKNLTNTKEKNLETESFCFIYFQNYFYKFSIL